MVWLVLTVFHMDFFLIVLYRQLEAGRKPLTLVLTVPEKDRVFFRTAQTVYSHTDYSTTTKCTVQYTIYTYRTAHGTVQWISNYCTVQYCKLADRTTALSKIIG